MREGETTKEREQEREPQFLKEREKREIVQGLFFHLLPLFLESPFFLCVCANKTNTRCYKKTEEGAERERENGEEGERRGRESGLLEGEVEEHGRCLPSLTFCSSSLLGRGYCSLSSSGLSSFLSLSFRSCPRSALFFPAECSAAAETSRETRRKRPKSSIHSDANADAFRFLSAGQRGRVFCSFHLALDDRRRHAASAE